MVPKCNTKTKYVLRASRKPQEKHLVPSWWWGTGEVKVGLYAPLDRAP